MIHVEAVTEPDINTNTESLQIRINKEVSIVGSNSYIPRSFIKTPNNEYVIVGVREKVGWDDLFLIKTDSNYNIILNKTYGWEGKDAAYSIIRAYDGNFVVTGNTIQIGSKGEDVLLIKFDDKGNIIWRKYFWGGNAWDRGNDLIETSNKDILMVGYTQDYASSYYDYYIIKTNSYGELLWSKTYKFVGNCYANSVVETNDGGYVIVGTISDMSNINQNVLLLKINKDGDFLWNRTYGGSGRDVGKDIIKVRDGYIIVGSSSSFNGDNSDVYVIKINYNGDIIWSKTYGTEEDNWGNKITAIDDETFAIIGGSFNKDASKSSDVYYLEINSSGELTYSETYGTESVEDGYDLIVSGNKALLLGDKGLKRKSIYLIELLREQYYSLSINSEHGVTSSEGNYKDGSRVTFNVSPNVVQAGEGVRYVFVEWRLDNGARVSTSSTASVIVNRDMVVNAVWKRQYYLNIRSELGGTVTPNSNWYDAGTAIIINATPEQKHVFSKWVGVGAGSYSGTSDTRNIVINGPVTQTATWTKIYTVQVNSEFEATGGGRYPEGATISLSTLHESGFWARKIFLKWVGDVESFNNPLILNVDRELNISAIYQTDYTYSIVTGILMIGVLGVFFYIKTKQKQLLIFKVNQQEKEQNIRDYVSKSDSRLTLADVSSMFGVTGETAKNVIVDALERNLVKGYLIKDSEFISEKALRKTLKRKIE